jgi:hypothetical protein
MFAKLKTLVASATLSAVAGVAMTASIGAAAIGYSPSANAWNNPFETICGEVACCSTEPNGSCKKRQR